MSTLSFERGTAFTTGQVRLSTTVEQLIELARERPGPLGRGCALDDDELARRLAMARAEVAALRAMTYAGVSRTAATGMPGPEGSIVKLYYSELQKAVGRLAMDLLGSEGLRLVPLSHPDGYSGRVLESFSYTIGGGTSEIQRNIIGDRVLGLPPAERPSHAPHPDRRAAPPHRGRRRVPAQQDVHRLDPRARRGLEEAVPGELWAAAAELGLLGLGLAEKFGGLGAGLVEESLVFREIGRVPSPGPFLSSTLGARVAAQAADIDLAERIISGRAPVGLVLIGPGARLDSDGLTGDVDLVDVTEGDLALVLTRDAVALVDTSPLGPPRDGRGHRPRHAADDRDIPVRGAAALRPRGPTSLSTFARPCSRRRC